MHSFRSKQWRIHPRSLLDFGVLSEQQAVATSPVAVLSGRPGLESVAGTPRGHVSILEIVESARLAPGTHGR